MTACPTFGPHTEKLLREAAEWRLIGLLLECPREGWIEEITSLADDITDPRLRTAAATAAREASPGLYHSIFGPGGPAPPREVSYHRGVLPGASLAGLRGLYEVFAFQPSGHEPADHVAVEAGFVGYLRLKQAFAVASGNQEHLEVCTKAEQVILQEHLSYMVGPLANTLAASGISYLAGAAEALHARVGPPPDNGALPLSSENELSDDECLAHS